MSWTRVAAAVSAAVLAGWAAVASAQDEFGRSGPYIGAGGVYAWENFSGSASATTPDDSWGYDIKGGYRFNPWFALEANWQQYVGFDDPAGDTDIWMAALNFKLFPLHGRIQPFASVGPGWSATNDDRAASSRDSNGFAVRFDGGLDVYLARNWAFTMAAGYVLQTSGRSDYGVVPLSFGVIYRFY
jgi:hypothetical protein